jgi:iron complex outermembrane receptor protein
MSERSRCLRHQSHGGRGSALAAARAVALSISAACLAAGGLTPRSAIAEQAAGGLEEIIVTAQRREQSLQEVPVSVSAFSAKQLEERSVTRLSEIAVASPNFSFVTADQQGNLLRIRGVGQSEGSLFFDPGVAVFLDGVYLPRMRGEDLDTAGVERIEVLRGPQGTLFGKNTIGGAVNIVTARPSGAFSGTADVTTGRFSRLDGRLSLEGSLVPGILTARVVGVVRTRDGYGVRRDYTTGDKTGESGDQDSSSGRLAVNWTPRADLDVLLSVDATSMHNRAGVHSLVAAFFATCPPNGPIAALNCFTDADYGPRFVTRDPYVSYASGPNYFRLDGWGTALNAHWRRGSWGIRSITGLRQQRNTYGVDFDGSPINVFEAATLERSRQFSQELQLSGLALTDKLNWVTGLYYADESARMRADTLIVQALYAAIGADSSSSLRIWQDSRSYAGYGQATYKLNDKLSATGGARYSYDWKESQRERARVNTGVVYVPRASIDGSWSALTGRLGLEYRWSPDIMTYLSAARGYKSGGINGAGVKALEFSPFDPEFLWTYEVGLRSEWLEQRLRFNMSAFYSDYSGMQFRSLQFDPDGGPINLIANVGSAKITGLEAELTALPARGWELGATLGYQHARYKNIAAGTTGVTKDMELPYTPDWTLSLFGQYTLPLHDGAELAGHVDYSYTDRQQLAVSNTPYLVQSAHPMVNARITYRSPGKGWELALFGTNLTDEKVMVTGSDLRTAGWIDAEYGAPRQWGANVQVKF